MITSAVVLYMRDNTGAMREWSISAIGDTITMLDTEDTRANSLNFRSRTNMLASRNG